MPGLDGPGLYGEIGRRFPSLQERIVFLTGDTMNAETLEFPERTGAQAVPRREGDAGDSAGARRPPTRRLTTRAEHARRRP